MGDNDHILDVVADGAKMDRALDQVPKIDPDTPTKAELDREEADAQRRR